MDPFSVLVGSLQIAQQCARTIVSLTKYINSVVTVHVRIQAFHDDVATLQNTYTLLEGCRNSPQMIAAAKAADRSTQHLWTHLQTTLRDCENTLVDINGVLTNIDRPNGLGAHLKGFWSRPVTQLLEQLNSGELGRHHERIKMYNTSLALPMQMIGITLQLSQKELNKEHQQRLENRLITMQLTIERLDTNIAEVRRPRRTSTMGSGATMVEERTEDQAMCKNMESFATKARQFLSNASSAAASTTGTQLGGVVVHTGPSEAGTPLDARQLRQITDWVPIIHEDIPVSPNLSEVTPIPSSDIDQASDEDDHELEMLQIFFNHGVEDLNQSHFSEAEENFIEALKLMQSTEFGSRVGFQPADLVLLLARCYADQEKYEQAVEELLPLTEGRVATHRRPWFNNGENAAAQKPGESLDIGRVLAAHHSLGSVYLKMQDFEKAEKHALNAFDGRRKAFTRTNEKTIESAQLVVDVCEATGKRAKARAYRSYLTVPVGNDRRLLDLTRRTSATTEGPPVPHILIPDEALSVDRTQNGGTAAISSSPFSTRNFRLRSSNDPQSATSTNPHAQFSPGHPSARDDASILSDTTWSSTWRETAAATAAVAGIRHTLKPRFDAVKAEARRSKGRGCEAALDVLKAYDPAPSRILIQRENEIKENIRRVGVDKGLAATGYGYAPIHFFCELKVEAITEVELLIEEGVNLMAVRHRAGYPSQEAMTPLQLAIERNHQVIAVTMIDSLLAKGTHISQVMALRDSNDFSPLLAACRQGQTETVSHLLRYGASVIDGFPSSSWYGNSLMHDAAWRCDTGMINLLLQRSRREDIGAITQQDQFGRTPLMYAIDSTGISNQTIREKKLRNRLHCVETLLRHAGRNLEAQFRIRDKHNMDVLAYARTEDDWELIALLEGYRNGTMQVPVTP